MYLIVFGILLFSLFLAMFSNEVKDKIYKPLLILLWLFLGLRYGQGTDYFGYKYIFDNINSLYEVIYNPWELHSEIGFRLLCYIFNSFELMVFVISSFEIYMLDRFIKRYSGNKVLSLVLFYPTYYLTYYFSALREGIVISLFIGILINFIEERKWKQYIIGVLIASSIHSVALILLVVPLIINIDNNNYILFILLSSIIGMIISSGIFHSVLIKIPFLGTRLSDYLNSSISVIALAERILSYFLIYSVFIKKNEKDLNKTNCNTQLLVKLYTIGTAIYLCTMSISLISSRTNIIFKIIEIVLITRINNKERQKNIVILIFIFISIIMTFKNINSYIEQGNYKNFVGVFNFPYVTVFNQEDIYSFRDSELYKLIE